MSLIFLLFLLVGVLVAVALHVAPDGYEDETGFHPLYKWTKS